MVGGKDQQRPTRWSPWLQLTSSPLRAWPSQSESPDMGDGRASVGSQDFLIGDSRAAGTNRRPTGEWERARFPPAGRPFPRPPLPGAALVACSSRGLLSASQAGVRRCGNQTERFRSSRATRPSPAVRSRRPRQAPSASGGGRPWGSTPIRGTPCRRGRTGRRRRSGRAR